MRWADMSSPFIVAKRDRPGDDLTRALIAARDDECLSDHELLSIVYQFFFAGFDSSAHSCQTPSSCC